MFKVDGKDYPSLEEAGRAYFPGLRITHADGSALTREEVDQALAAWLRSPPSSKRKAPIDDQR